MKAGILAGYEVVDVKVELYDGSYHEVDSSEMAFKIAGSIAFKEALKQANAVLMEPVMKVAVIVPDDYLGDSYRRPQLTSWSDPGSGNKIRFISRSMLSFRFLKCSATLQTSVPTHRDAVSIQWSPTAMRKCLRASLKRSWLTELRTDHTILSAKDSLIFIKSCVLEKLFSPKHLNLPK